MIKHNTSSVIVFQTIEYKNFTMINGNRGLNENKIKKIIKEIEGGNNMLPYYPIQVRVVGEKMEILDGQHRFFICKKLKVPVHYILVTESKSMSDIAKVNSNVEKWKPQDFINCYIQQGNDDYKKLQSFIESYKISVGVSLRLLSNGTPGVQGSDTPLMEKFEHGLFKVTYWDAAVEIAELCKLFSVSELFRDRSFIIAIYRIKIAGLITINELAEIFLKQPEMLTRQANYKGYISNLEAIVNKGKQKRIVIS